MTDKQQIEKLQKRLVMILIKASSTASIVGAFLHAMETIDLSEMNKKRMKLARQSLTKMDTELRKIRKICGSA